ncbi:MAG: SDR family oxidoreductase, partial [Gemmatimonadaceae bacterium]|nr:SDR family oxidoreductase [Gemmatimonadaceae bacterium]
TPVLLDIAAAAGDAAAARVRAATGRAAHCIVADITDPAQVTKARDQVLERFGRVDALINNAAENPKMESGAAFEASRFEHFALERWDREIAVGLTGAFLCAQAFGTAMAKAGAGSIVNVASDLAVIAPDQRLYAVESRTPDQQPVKPVTYSVVKTALIGLTRYLATYWADRGVRANAISPGGVYAGQPDEFVARLAERIPMGRMAREDEYGAAIVFLCSEASSYMTGQNLVIDGGRSAW